MLIHMPDGEVRTWLERVLGKSTLPAIMFLFDNLLIWTKDEEGGWSIALRNGRSVGLADMSICTFRIRLTGTTGGGGSCTVCRQRTKEVGRQLRKKPRKPCPRHSMPP